MKIGILTFHWGANHGAVLQAYASQKYLENKYNADVKIIDYYPKNQELSYKKAFKTKRFWKISENIKLVKKNKRISYFREKLSLTKRYYSNEELKNDSPEFDIMLCGSDQIWNPYYAMKGEGKITPVYFLNFGKEACKRVALSVSFGCIKYPNDAKEVVLPYINKFDAISVRENTGLEILKEMGVEKGEVTADPTSLLMSKDYLEICSDISKNTNENVALCILRSQSKEAKSLIKALVSREHKKVNDISNLSVEKWMAGIRDASVVITNSFHCVMMCLKLHIPFWIVLEKGALSGMNDRMFTLMKKFQLEERIVTDIKDNEKQIDWANVDLKMKEYSKSLEDFLDENITL